MMTFGTLVLADISLASLLWWLIVGLIAGFLASVVMRGGGYGIIDDIIVGIVGEVEPMRNALRRRFWPEMGLTIVTSILFVFTLAQRNWIEMLFGLDPDQGNGSLEWLIIGALLVVSITLFMLAGYELRRARAAIS